MKITKIAIENFKSIEKIEFDIKKYGDSYTTMLVGLNECGKSNILQAMSLLNPSGQNVNYFLFANQKLEDNKKYEYVDLFFYLEFQNKDTYLKPIQQKFINGKLLDFTITELNKNVYLGKEDTNFKYDINYKITFNSKLFFRSRDEHGNELGGFQLSKNQNEANNFEELNEKEFQKYFYLDIEEIVNNHIPRVSLWKPSEKYLISNDIKLSDFNSNIPLKNIFALSGYSAIQEIDNPQQRSKLQSKLSKNLTNYVKNIWKHEVDFIIEISETGNFSLSIKDSGENNEDDRHAMNARSDGFKQFISLILSLSIETEKLSKENRLILIDEPEAHLHPSAIRDLKKELIKIGKENYLFISTHSPFLIDRENKERNIIIKKNESAITEKKEISEHQNIIDDEVLREAFGIEVYKDLLNPHSMIVEGHSDKVILQKAFNILDIKDIRITNGHGSNIDTLASKFNEQNISILVILDDDKDGKQYKEKIIKIGGSYSENNVFTIRDLVGEIKDKGTIEDTLSKAFVEGQFKEYFKDTLKDEINNFSLNDEFPFIEQIKIYLNKQKIENINNELENFKKQISENFKPTKSSFNMNFPLLNKLIENIAKKLNIENNQP